MPAVEIAIPANVDVEIDRLVEEGEFVNRQQAIEGLLSTGLSVHGQVDEPQDEMRDDVFTQAQDDQLDPAMDDVREDDDYAF